MLPSRERPVQPSTSAQSQSLSSSDPSLLKPHFDKISSSISYLEKLIAQNSYFLPSYDVRTSLKTVADLKHALEALTSQLLPRKKFSFKTKAPATNQVNNNNNKNTLLSRDSEKMRFAVHDSPRFRNKSGEVLIGKFRDSEEVEEFTLSDLDSCEVRIIGCVSTLFVHRLKDCRVYVGAVTGSVLIEDLEGCVFTVASHQIRIHAARRSENGLPAMVAGAAVQIQHTAASTTTTRQFPLLFGHLFPQIVPPPSAIPLMRPFKDSFDYSDNNVANDIND